VDRRGVNKADLASASTCWAGLDCFPLSSTLADGVGSVRGLLGDAVAASLLATSLLATSLLPSPPSCHCSQQA